MSRHFTIKHSEIGVTGGEFTGEVPYRVAAKAARSLFSQLSGKKQEKKGEIRFVLRETTQNSNKKEFHYIGMKKSLETPIVVKRGDKDIEIRHTYHVKSCSSSS